MFIMMMQRVLPRPDDPLGVRIWTWPPHTAGYQNQGHDHGTRRGGVLDNGGGTHNLTHVGGLSSTTGNSGEE